MVLDITKYIGDKLLEANPFIDAFGNNCIALKDGRIVNFIGEEKNDFSPSDIIGIGAYTRINPNITFSDGVRRTSETPTERAEIKFRLVVFQCGRTPKLNPAKLEKKIRRDLNNIDFAGYGGNELEIDVATETSNLNFTDNFKLEVGKDYDIGADSVIIALNCSLSWEENQCEGECDVYEDNEKC